MAKRIYLISDLKDPSGQLLVRASTQSQAVRAATRNRFDVKLASQDDLVRMLKTGVEPLEASDKEEEPLVVAPDAPADV